MSRALLLLAGAAIVLAALYLGLGGRADSAALSSLGPGAAGAALVGLLAGFVGAAIANRFNIGRRGDEGLAERVAALESARDSARARTASPPPPPPVAKDGPVPERTFLYDTPRQEPRPREEPAAPPPPRPASAPTPTPPPPPEPANAQAPAPSPPPEPPRRAAVPNMNEISAAYSRIVSGQISRSAFADFFDSIGRSGPVEVAEGGSSIGPASGSESFLTCVNAGTAFLVFPSYDFIANQPTQFATIASVPESVAAVFTLERGDGELILERAAVYEETESGLRRVEKGEIRGFGG